MVSSRIFLGQMSSRATADDVKEFFRGYGKIIDISMKNGYGFVEFEDERDAEDAIRDKHGKEMRGERIVVEQAHGRSSIRNYESRPAAYGDRYNRNRYDDGNNRNRSRIPPRSTRHRLIVKNLSTRYTWFDLKDLMNQYAEVTFADAHKTESRVGVVCFATRSGLKRALEKGQGKEINGRCIKLIDDSMGSPSRSRSRDRRSSPGTHRSKSHSLSKGRHRSRTASKSRSRSSSNSCSRSCVRSYKNVKSPKSKNSRLSNAKSSSSSPPPSKKNKAVSESRSDKKSSIDERLSPHLEVEKA